MAALKEERGVDLVMGRHINPLELYNTVCLKKNIPDIFSYNSRKHCGIFIIFGTHITEKVGNQQML